MNSTPRLKIIKSESDRKEGSERNSGWVKIHRSLLNSFCFQSAERMYLWVTLLLKATHRPLVIDWGGKPLTLKPGQLVTSRKSLSAVLKMHESKVERLLRSLEIGQQIEQLSNRQSRIITISNWNLYQSSELQLEQRPDNDRTTPGRPPNTNKNEKNYKNEKKYITVSDLVNLEFPKIFDTEEVREAVAAFIDYKIRIKEPYKTVASVKSLFTTAQKSRASPEFFAFAIHYAIAKPWKGVGWYQEVYDAFERSRGTKSTAAGGPKTSFDRAQQVVTELEGMTRK